MPSSTYTCPASDLLLFLKQWMILVFIVSRRVSDVKHCLTVKYQLFTNTQLMVLIGRCVAGWAWWWWYSWTIKVAATGSSTTRHGTAWRWPTSSSPGGCTRLVLVGANVLSCWVHASSPDSFTHFFNLVLRLFLVPCFNLLNIRHHAILLQTLPFYCDYYILGVQ